MPFREPLLHRIRFGPGFREVFCFLAVVLTVALAGEIRLVTAQEADSGFAPASGHAAVIAQGVVLLPEGEAVWRTVRTRALLPEEARFEERPLGFVLATSGPLLLVNEPSGEQFRLGVGEAALVRAGAVWQIASLATEPAGYLSIDLVAPDAPAPPEGAVVLQPGQPFPSPPGLHDLDLLRDTVGVGESFTVPDSGEKNVILITEGAATVGRPDGDGVVLLAGEAASFSGELVVAPARDGGAERASFVVGIIGPGALPPPVASQPVATVAPEAPVTPKPSTGPEAGSIAVQIYTCPPGMNAGSLNPAACAPALEEFDVTLSGTGLPSPLTIGDATAAGGSFTWGDLPFGDYVIAEAVLPRGFSTYVLSARNASGSPEAGYRISLGEAEPDMQVRIYNFVAE